MKPELKVNYVKLTVKGDLPSQFKINEAFCLSPRTKNYEKINFNRKGEGAMTEMLKDVFLNFWTAANRKHGGKSPMKLLKGQ